MGLSPNARERSITAWLCLELLIVFAINIEQESKYSAIQIRKMTSHIFNIRRLLKRGIYVTLQTDFHNPIENENRVLKSATLSQYTKMPLSLI